MFGGVGGWGGKGLGGGVGRIRMGDWEGGGVGRIRVGDWEGEWAGSRDRNWS